MHIPPVEVRVSAVAGSMVVEGSTVVEVEAAMVEEAGTDEHAASNAAKPRGCAACGARAGPRGLPRIDGERANARAEGERNDPRNEQ